MLDIFLLMCYFVVADYHRTSVTTVDCLWYLKEVQRVIRAMTNKTEQLLKWYYTTSSLLLYSSTFVRLCQVKKAYYFMKGIQIIQNRKFCGFVLL